MKRALLVLLLSGCGVIRSQSPSRHYSSRPVAVGTPVSAIDESRPPSAVTDFGNGREVRSYQTLDPVTGDYRETHLVVKDGKVERVVRTKAKLEVRP